MKTMKTITLALLVGLTGCGLTDPEDDFVEVWSGIAIPLASNVAADADTTAADTTWVFVFHERDTQSNVVHATITIYETQTDPCELWWLDDTGSPCYYVTKGSGIQGPFDDPETRVVDFTLPTLGECELAGPVTAEDVWATLFRCGPSKRSYYRIDFTEVVEEAG